MKKKKRFIVALPWIATYFFGMFTPDLHDKILKLLKISPRLYYSEEEGSGLTCWNDGSRAAEDITFFVSWEEPDKGATIKVPRPVELGSVSQTPLSVGGKIYRLFKRDDGNARSKLRLPEELNVVCKSRISGVSIVAKGDCEAVELPITEPNENGLVIQ